MPGSSIVFMDVVQNDVVETVIGLPDYIEQPMPRVESECPSVT